MLRRRHRLFLGRVGRQLYPNKEYELCKWNAKLTSFKATIHFLYSYKRDTALPVCVRARVCLCAVLELPALWVCPLLQLSWV